MSSTAHGTTPYYFVPQPSRHPAMAAFGLFWVFFGAANWINGSGWGEYALFAGLAWLFWVLFQWFRFFEIPLDQPCRMPREFEHLMGAKLREHPQGYDKPAQDFSNYSDISCAPQLPLPFELREAEGR